MKMNPLAAYLAKHDVSQGAFARRLGVKSGVVCRWCTGRRMPTLHSALAIARETNDEVPVSAWEVEPESTGPKPRAAKARRAGPRNAAAREIRSHPEQD